MRAMAVVALSSNFTVIKTDLPSKHWHPVWQILGEPHPDQVRAIPNWWESRIQSFRVKTFLSDLRKNNKMLILYLNVLLDETKN